MVPSTSGADFDHVASYVGTSPACLAPELAEISQRQSAWRKAGPERERDVHELLVFADRALGLRLAP
jgi:hypothetical protein